MDTSSANYIKTVSPFMGQEYNISIAGKKIQLIHFGCIFIILVTFGTDELRVPISAIFMGRLKTDLALNPYSSGSAISVKLEIL